MAKAKNSFDDDEQGIRSLSEWLRDVGQNNERTVGFAQEVLDENGGKTVRVTFEDRLVTPERAESPPRAHMFHDVDGFAEYLAANKTEHTVVLADVAGRVVSAVLNDRAEKQFEIVTYKPQVHPLFAPWMEQIGTTCRLEQFTQFLMANRRVVIEPKGKELVYTLSQIRASDEITIRKGFGQGAVNGIMCKTTIQSETKAEAVDVPEILRLRMPLFVGTEEIEFEVDLMMLTAKSEIFVELTSAELAERMLDVFERQLGEIDKIDGIITTLGRTAYSRWDYVQ
jgi:hypothetical protein